MVVETPDPDAANRISAALSQAGLSVTRVGEIGTQPGHWEATLASATEPADVVAAMHQLRAEPWVRFAAPGYRTRRGDYGLLLLNRLMVQFENGIGREAVDSLIARLGMALIRVPVPDSGRPWYSLGYARGADPPRCRR